ncbi:MAG: hypothetical protein OXE84_03170 [Rhodobacteraceae bacterium]|nr:hypothetical protein [Paracoccaceae bacterium]MCY4196377.1 hypothetical protein [Paracoccaceae bacterium]MCY4326146.1 hypothetical protein [Paracoccaceae bacterium]
MNFETLTIIVAIVGTGIALAAVIVPGQRDLKQSVADLRERMARLEGLFDGFTKSRSN